MYEPQQVLIGSVLVGPVLVDPVLLGPVLVGPVLVDSSDRPLRELLHLFARKKCQSQIGRFDHQLP